MVHSGVGPIPAGVTGISLYLTKSQMVPLHKRAKGEPALRVNVGTKWALPRKLESDFWGPDTWKMLEGLRLYLVIMFLLPSRKSLSQLSLAFDLGPN